MKAPTSLLAAGLASVALAGPAIAAETLTVSSWGGPNHGINTIVWPTWKAWIEEATEGRVTLDVVHDMGPPAAQMALVADGVADASWIFHGHMAGRFELTRLPEFPTFEDFSSEIASAAYWRTYETYLAEQGEHRGVDVLAVGVHGPGQIFTADKAESFADLEGRRLRVGGGVMSDLASAMGVTGVALPPTGVYESASQGVIDGAMLTLEGLRSFRVAEVAPYTLTVDGGFYRGSFAIVVNPYFWDRISAEDKAAIEDVSGESLSRLFGYMMDVSDERGVAFAEELGHTFTEATAEDIAMLREVSDGLIDEWADKVSSGELDAREALEFFRDQLGQVDAEAGIVDRVVTTEG
ncbi:MULTISPECIES: TRAP transporter substrate-binding protein [unclassified Halomonas]|uniref:TRAP transporter substrate-binding protein n=1 Tax=unclassified Halomonas TaxID=2609666 RepID=UPI000C893F91|nr:MULTISPECIES: TRAP transporter substrate-binding protein [unclassified Halomonas]MAR73426.1 C4-dicarboxylate ABC transporter substrate-binding protein [Halomonas sp.]|tara:strand:- start:2584 stop:3639 length:1056 start_codon:yes stop_codon:yes gene_type:complete